MWQVVQRVDGSETLRLINWAKRQAYAKVIEDVRFYQQTHYNLSVCEPLQDYLHFMSGSGVIINDTEQYARSLEVEPRAPS